MHNMDYLEPIGQVYKGYILYSVVGKDGRNLSMVIAVREGSDKIRSYDVESVKTSIDSHLAREENADEQCVN